jgi:hypothetical protein
MMKPVRDLTLTGLSPGSTEKIPAKIAVAVVFQVELSRGSHDHSFFCSAMKVSDYGFNGSGMRRFGRMIESGDLRHAESQVRSSVSC